MQGEMRSQDMEGPLNARAHAKDKKRLTWWKRFAHKTFFIQFGFKESFQPGKNQQSSHLN